MSSAENREVKHLFLNRTEEDMSVKSESSGPCQSRVFAGTGPELTPFFFFNITTSSKETVTKVIVYSLWFR